MNLKLFMMYEGGVSTQLIATGKNTHLIASPRWEFMSGKGDIVYFHPEESVHEFIGELFLKGYAINFIPFNDMTLLPERKTIFFLVRQEPEGLWIDGQRWAEPAKGTRVR